MSPSGQLHVLPRRNIAVRFTSVSGPHQRVIAGLLSARRRHMRRSKQHHYSITSSVTGAQPILPFRRPRLRADAGKNL
jgi:hypothetical protein